MLRQRSPKIEDNTAYDPASSPYFLQDNVRTFQLEAEATVSGSQTCVTSHDGGGTFYSGFYSLMSTHMAADIH